MKEGAVAPASSLGLGFDAAKLPGDKSREGSRSGSSKRSPAASSSSKNNSKSSSRSSSSLSRSAEQERALEELLKQKRERATGKCARSGTDLSEGEGGSHNDVPCVPDLGTSLPAPPAAVAVASGPETVLDLDAKLGDWARSLHSRFYADMRAFFDANLLVVPPAVPADPSASVSAFPRVPASAVPTVSAANVPVQPSSSHRASGGGFVPPPPPGFSPSCG